MSKRTVGFYDIMFRVRSDKIGAALDTMRGVGEMIKCERSLAEDVEPRTSPRGVEFHYRNGKRNKGIKGEDLLVELLTGHRLTLKDIQDAFERRGFARTSASPNVSKALAAKKIILIGDKYKMRRQDGLPKPSA